MRVPRSSFSSRPECARTSVTNEAITTSGPGAPSAARRAACREAKSRATRTAARRREPHSAPSRPRGRPGPAGARQARLLLGASKRLSSSRLETWDLPTDPFLHFASPPGRPGEPGRAGRTGLSPARRGFGKWRGACATPPRSASGAGPGALLGCVTPCAPPAGGVLVSAAGTKCQAAALGPCRGTSQVGSRKLFEFQV